MCENKNEDLRFNIERANEIVRLAENRRYKFLDINLALVTAFSFLFVYLLEVFNYAGKLAIISSMIVYFIWTCWNIGYNLQENRTNPIKKALCSNREWMRDEFIQKIQNIRKIEFRKDYKQQLINLHEYQRNYNKIGKKTRIYTFTGLINFLITFLISILGNVLYQYSNLELFIIWGAISSIGLSSIIVFVWMCILLKAE